MSGAAEDRLMPDTFNRHVANVYPALAMLAGMQLDVFSPLADGPRTVAEVAAALAVNPQKLRPLMYALVTAGLLAVDGECFANTAEADEFLVKGRPRYLGGTHETYADLWASTLHTAQSIRTGRPQAKHDFSAMSYGELRAFIRGLDSGASATARRLHKDFEMRRFRRLIDAGGGSGGLSVALCRLCPDLHATVAELSNVARVTRECIDESRLADRIDVIEADLSAASPPGRYDAAVLRALLQVMGAADARRTVANVAAALEPGGTLFAVGRVLDDSRLSPLDAVAVNVMFLNVYDDGQAYTESEYRAWFEDAGLVRVERRALAGGYSIIHGVKT
jgi:O-methyltransferase domain/Dimerisation domain